MFKVVKFVLLSNYGQTTRGGPHFCSTNISERLTKRHGTRVGGLGCRLDFGVPQRGRITVRNSVALHFSLTSQRRILVSFQRRHRGVGRIVTGKIPISGIHFRGRRVVLPTSSAIRKTGKVQVHFATNGRSLGQGSRCLCALLIPSHTHAMFPYFRRPGLGTRFALRLRLPTS